MAVTGADGFVGRALVPRLQRAGHQVVSVVRRDPAHPLKDVNYAVVGDLELADPALWLDGTEVLVHLVARTHSADINDPAARSVYERVNVELTRRLARTSAELGVHRFMFISSVKVNGERTTGRPFREADAPAPEDLYGHTKLEAERVLEQISRECGLDYTILRPPLIHGPGVQGNLLRLLRIVDCGLPLPLGSIRNARSLIGLNNLCDAIIQCMGHPAASNGTFLVSDDENWSTPELIRLMAESLGKRAILPTVPVSLLGTCARVLGRASDFERLAGSLQVDSSKLRRAIGWCPLTSVAAQMRETAAWFRSGAAP